MPSLEAIENAIDAIPPLGCDPWTANMICRRAHPPRMQMRDVEAMLDWLVEQGEIVRTIGEPPGLMKHYSDPKKPRPMSSFDAALDAPIRDEMKGANA
ncbi:hypothetical protein MASR1M8_16200 [Thermomonas brevis]